MATIAPHNATQHSFIEKKPPMLPRQSTSDVLSFTQIIADRLSPGQNVWDYFSPAPESLSSTPISPLAASPQVSASPAPTSPASPSFGQFGFFNKRQSMIVDTNSVAAQQSLVAVMDSNAAVPPTAPMTKNQKRKSFAQSLRSMLSLSQLLSPAASKSSSAHSSASPHFNILVLGSDSAPLASTLYKMSSVLPSTTKISHYQEISGFFVAYFRSNGSFTCSPKSSTELSSADKAALRFREEGEIKSRRRPSSKDSLEEIVQELSVGTTPSSSSSRTKPQLPPLDTATTTQTSIIPTGVQRRSSEESAETLSSTTQRSPDGDLSALSRATTRRGSSSSHSATTVVDEIQQEQDEMPQSPSAKANASLSVHAFSLDTTWPVPRHLAQTFWFPYAHGIIYIVDATRKNDPRGMDHLISARTFLASLMADTTFKRRDIPVVVFANKAGLDEATCFRVDEIADILGCEEWDGDVTVQGGDATARDLANLDEGSSTRSRAWCVKSTRSDGDGDGLRESVEWLKSRMGEVWKM
ncbi:hypothetical protein BG004_001887 [Podila humilis]|nr:hypothetical protein BG004_001887 [Podila humilis]